MSIHTTKDIWGQQELKGETLYFLCFLRQLGILKIDIYGDLLKRGFICPGDAYYLKEYYGLNWSY